MDVIREKILPRLDGIRRNGSGYMARCPVHDDGTASLSISIGTNQPVVLHCHANCPTDDILAEIGLTWADISEPREEMPKLDVWTPAGPAVAVYDYCDEEGTILYQVCRTANKDFRQRVPDATKDSGYRWNLDGVPRILYRLPDLIHAVSDGKIIYICEGEKDVNTLVAKGLAATCNSGGAGKWRTEYAKYFADTHVVICADKDDPGRAHARQVRDILDGTTQSITIVEAADGCKDPHDHITAGHSVEEFITTWTSVLPEQADLAHDLWEFLSTEDPEYDWIIPDLLERSDRLILTGFEGMGKSMLTRQMAVCIAAGIHPFRQSIRYEPKTVLIIDCENTPRQSRRKFQALADATEKVNQRVPDGGLRIIFRPGGIDLTRPKDTAWLAERVTAHKPDALFIGPFYKLHNDNPNDELPARKVVYLLDQIRENLDCAIVIEAHAGHGDSAGRSVRPYGTSLLLRWPEFGYGLAPTSSDEKDKRAKFQQWRGPRDERQWPKYLTWGNTWPWVETSEPEGTRGRKTP
jgi:hypothetical protein